MTSQIDAQTDPQKAFHSAPIIGYHRAPLSQKFGAPRQPNLVGLISAIEMVAPFDTPAAFVGLEDFSHLWISWQFHHNRGTNNNDANHNQPFRPQVRPPRLGGNQKIGVFASRSMYRPSQLGLSVVKLERIQVLKGRVVVIISGADMIDATPIIDIKPYVAYSDSIEHAQSGFAPIAPISLEVTMSAEAQVQLLRLTTNDADSIDNIASKNDTDSDAVIYKLQQQLVAEDKDLIQALIAQDPRPAYRRKEINTTFIMRYKSVDVSFCQIELGTLQIVAINEVL